MSRSLLPRRWWDWVSVVLLVLLLAAVLFPVTAYSGPGISHGRVAYDMANQYRLTSRWPADEEDHKLTRVPRFHSYAYRLQDSFVDPKLPKPFVHAAIYRIVVDGREETWKVNEVGRPERLNPSHS
jgi:hypothetical protein